MQELHTSEVWPVPLVKGGLLVEVEFDKVATSITLLGGTARNLPTALVRGRRSDDTTTEFFVEKTGDVGRRVLVPEISLRYLEDPEYKACGLEIPDPETNNKGDLAFISVARLVAYMEPTETLPFTPLGDLVFFDFDVKETEDLVELDSGILLAEKSLAGDNLMATVRGVGPDVVHVQVGDRVIARRSSDAVEYENETYFFNKEAQLLAKIEKV